MTLQDLEARLKVLEDVEAIKRLKARYCAYCDDNYDAAGIAALFTEDAVWDGGMRGRAEGREEIREFFKRSPDRISFAVHMVTNSMVEVDGNTAKGTWYLFQPCTWTEGNRAVWGSAKYHEEYVRVDGDWKFRNLKLTSFFWTPFDQGWAQNRFG